MSIILNINDIRFSWPGSKPFELLIPQLQLEAGQKLCLFGPSGSGKSTLLNLISGVLTPQGLGISVCGNELSELTATQRDCLRADHIGVIFQQFNLLPALNVQENVVLPCKISAASTSARATTTS